MKKQKRCEYCQKVFYKKLTDSKKRWGKARYCSRKCSSKAWVGHSAPKTAFPKGHTPWNKGIVGLKPYMNLSGIKNIKGKKHPNWKGEKAKYAAIHTWVNTNKVKPNKCTSCGKIGNSYQIHWSNIDHKYRRNLDDYVALCASCHKKYDLSNGLCKH